MPHWYQLRRREGSANPPPSADQKPGGPKQEPRRQEKRAERDAKDPKPQQSPMRPTEQAHCFVERESRDQIPPRRLAQDHPPILAAIGPGQDQQPIGDAFLARDRSSLSWAAELRAKPLDRGPMWLLEVVGAAAPDVRDHDERLSCARGIDRQRPTMVPELEGASLSQALDGAPAPGGQPQLLRGDPR